MSRSTDNHNEFKMKVTDCISTIINNTKVIKNSYIRDPVIYINYSLIEDMKKDGKFELNSITTSIPFKVCTRVAAFLTGIKEYKVKHDLPENCSEITLNVKSKKTLVLLLFLFYFSANENTNTVYKFDGNKNKDGEYYDSEKMNLFYNYFKSILEIYVDQFGQNNEFKAFGQFLDDLNIFAESRFKDEIFDFIFKKNAQIKNERVQKIYSFYIPKTRQFHRKRMWKGNNNYPFKIPDEPIRPRSQNLVNTFNNSLEPPFKRSAMQPVHEPNIHSPKVQYSTIHPNIYKELTGKNYPKHFIYKPHSTRMRTEPLRENTITPYRSRPVLLFNPYNPNLYGGGINLLDCFTIS